MNLRSQSAGAGRGDETDVDRAAPSCSGAAGSVDQELWSSVIERPLRQLIEARFADDTVRGLVLTDAVIGTFTSAHDPSLQQNRCFLYHMIGNGDGEWRVPVGGMGAVTAELVRVAQEAKVSIRTGCPVDAIKPLPDGGATIFLADREAITADVILANCAPATLQRLLGNPYQPPVGSQTKINIVVRRLPVSIRPSRRSASLARCISARVRQAAAGVRGRIGRSRSPIPCRVRSIATR